MKTCAIFVILAFAAIGDALPFAGKRMIYYQQPVAGQYYNAPQRMMYVQYMQPSYGHARSTQAASALVAGEHVATGTYLEDCNPAETDVAAPTVKVQHDEDVLGAAGVHSAHSVAEAYPDDNEAAPAPPPSRSQTVEVEQTPIADVPVPVEDETQKPFESDDEAKAPRVYNFEKHQPAELPAPAPIAPVATSGVVPPARRYLPSKKKVYVELDEATYDVEEPDTENAVATVEDEENNQGQEDEETDVAPVVPVVPQKPIARRPAAKKPVKSVKPLKAAADCAGCAKASTDCASPCVKAGSAGSSKPQLPAGTFFPIDFGGTNGGAIAIANSFSTGEGGSATSHAIAYGSPDSVRARAKPSKLH